MRDLLEGALIQSANNAADALASAASGGDVPRFVAWMNARARALGLRDTHFVRPDGLDAPGHVSSARDVAVLAQVAMHSPVVRDLVRERSDTIEGGTLRRPHVERPARRLPRARSASRPVTRPTRAGARSRRRAGTGYTIYAVILGSPTRARRNDDSTGCSPGACRSTGR